MENTNNALTLKDDNMIVDLASSTNSFCSFVADTDEAKAKLFGIANNPDERLADCINKKIMLKDIFVEEVTCTNTESGEVSVCPRVVLIDDKARSYQCVSIGIFSAVKKLIAVYGMPTWEKPIPIEVKQISKGTKKMLSLSIVTK